LEPALLLLLHRGPAHGYTLIERLREFQLSGMDATVVYRALRDMEAQGWVVSSWDTEETQGPPRRVYRLTASGDEALKWWTQDLAETRQMIDQMVVSYRRHMDEDDGDYH
jgi:DNA-binding PadR family transcriptional regulator